MGICFQALGSTAYAAANCWCKTSCTFGDGSVYSSGDSWSKYQHKGKSKKFKQPVTWGGKQMQACRSYCQGHQDNLDLLAIAEKRGAEGEFSCKSEFHIGTSQKKGMTTIRKGTYQKDDDIGSTSQGAFQYSAKYACGRVNGETDERGLFENGHYYTTVNVHNPNDEPVRFRRKTARANLASDGRISDFEYGSIGPDGAQYFHCAYIKDISNNTSPTIDDGFFVIESEKPLDVVTYYSNRQLSGDRLPAVGAPSIDVEIVKQRDIPERQWNCRSNLRIDLSNPAIWRTASNQPAVQVSNPVNAWDTQNGRRWMSYTADARPQGTRFPYSLDFCSCSEQGGRIRGNIRSDNTSSGTYTSPSSAPAPLFNITINNSYHASQPQTNFGAAITGAGNGRITLDVRDSGLPTGVSIQGTLQLPSGYLGRCRP